MNNNDNDNNNNDDDDDDDDDNYYHYSYNNDNNNNNNNNNDDDDDDDDDDDTERASLERDDINLKRVTRLCAYQVDAFCCFQTPEHRGQLEDKRVAEKHNNN